MTTSKFYIIVMSACCFLAIGNKPSCASTALNEEDKLLAELKKALTELKEGGDNRYLDGAGLDANDWDNGKTYSVISNPVLHDRVQELCNEKCNAKSCQTEAIKTECEELCPNSTKGMNGCLQAKAR